MLGASDWIADQQARLCEGLQLSWKRMPCANTYSYVLARLDSQEVNAALAAWMVRKEAQSRCGEEPSRLAAQSSERSVHLAIDGKALKGTGKQLYGGEEPMIASCCMCMKCKRALSCEPRAHGAETQ